MRYVFLVLGLIAVLIINTSHSYAKEAKILAIVDDEVISNIDLDRRVNLIKQISVFNPEEESILRYLIDELLFFKYAHDLNIVVSDAEVNSAIKGFGIDTTSLDQKELFAQVKAKIIWNKMVSQYILPIVSVSEEEVNNYIHNMLHVKNAIFLVKLFQDHSSNWQESIMGWVNITDLDPKVKEVIEKLVPGKASEPLVFDGSKVKFKFIDIENNNVLKFNFRLRKVPKDINVYKNEYCNFEVMDLKSSDLSAKLRKELLMMKEHEFTGVIKDVSGRLEDYRFVLCGSSMRADISQYLYFSKVEVEQKNYLTKLRENSFIEIRA